MDILGTGKPMAKRGPKGTQDRQGWDWASLTVVADVRRYQPEAVLWGAVLNQAKNDYENTSTKRYAPIYRGQAIAWIGDRRETDIGSFIWICELLGLDPGAVRNAIFGFYTSIPSEKAA